MSNNRGTDQADLRALSEQAAGAMRRGDAVSALRFAREVLQIESADATMLALAANASLRLRDWKGAIEIGEQWLKHRPADPHAIHALAHAYFELGEFLKSRDVYRALIEAHPDSAEYLGIYARACLAAFDYEEAARALQKAMSLRAASSSDLFTLARLKMFLGAIDEAKALNADAIKNDRNFAPAYAQYVTLHNGDAEEEITTQIERLAHNQHLAPEHRASLFLAMGNISHRRKEYAAAMDAFHRGNEISSSILRAEGRDYHPADFERRRRRENAVFSTQPKSVSYKEEAVTPVFVVGMPRSGTTLVESMLAAHPQVYGAGELGAMPVIYHQVLSWAEKAGGAPLADAPAEQLREWRSRYIASYPQAGDARFIVDKQPFNFMAGELIKTLFPEAIIIHIRRNPLDTGFSIYRNDFGKAWPYATSMENIAHFYGQYARIAKVAEHRLGPAFATFQYEELIADFEIQARRLFDICGLEWRSEYRDFHRLKRPVATFSSTQVREPLRKTATHVRAEYGYLLSPLIDGLQRAGVDLDTGAVKTDPVA